MNGFKIKKVGNDTKKKKKHFLTQIRRNAYFDQNHSDLTLKCEEIVTNLYFKE